MASVSAPRAPRPASAPPAVVRHGTCRFELTIGGTTYRLAPAITGERLSAVVSLRKTAEIGDGNGHSTYAVAIARGEVSCTCPDHRVNGATCKHIQALRAIARIVAPFAPAEEKARKRSARRPGPAVRPESVPSVPPTGGFEVCDSCGSEFDISLSNHPYLCLHCAAEGGAL